ncbi:MAG: hypothetical protein ACYC0F_16380 [Rhodanobacter sp.]
MRNGRLHAYEVLLRVAKVRETRASLALAEASAQARACRMRCDEVGEARAVVASASRMNAVDESRLDLARYEMLSDLDALLAQKLQAASDELAGADQLCLERARASVSAKRYREQVDGRAMEASEALERKQSASQQEDAFECWLGSGVR